MAQPSPDHIPAYVKGSHFGMFIEPFDANIPFERNILAVEVLHTFPSTTSLMKLVQFTIQGIPEKAVLKLYDRTHPGRIRGFTAPSITEDGAYRSFVRSRKMRNFTPRLESNRRDTPDGQTAIGRFSYNVQDASTPDTKAEFEAAIWYEFDQRHKTELRAYKQLQSMQGTKIPRIYANVRIPLSVIDKGGQATPEEEEYLSVPGILLQYYECRNLCDLQFPGRVQIESDPLHFKWASLAQRAVDAIHEINDLGIILRSYNNNAIFKRQNGNEEPYIIDFAEVVFKEDLIEDLIKARERAGFAVAEYLPWQREVRYWEMAKSYGNPAAISEAFRTHLRNLQVSYLGCKMPNYEKIIDEIMRQCGESQNIQT
ncbi:hypothetical protein H9Q71_013348 [Fusarium xylarioides]|nr:hypothetical protein H9Q71_013348 [Fusarium xylarioides]